MGVSVKRSGIFHTPLIWKNLILSKVFIGKLSKNEKFQQKWSFTTKKTCCCGNQFFQEILSSWEVFWPDLLPILWDPLMQEDRALLDIWVKCHNIPVRQVRIIIAIYRQGNWGMEKTHPSSCNWKHKVSPHPCWTLDCERLSFSHGSLVAAYSKFSY